MPSTSNRIPAVPVNGRVRVGERLLFDDGCRELEAPRPRQPRSTQPTRRAAKRRRITRAPPGRHERPPIRPAGLPPAAHQRDYAGSRGNTSAPPAGAGSPRLWSGCRSTVTAAPGRSAQWCVRRLVVSIVVVPGSRRYEFTRPSSNHGRRSPTRTRSFTGTAGIRSRSTAHFQVVSAVCGRQAQVGHWFLFSVSATTRREVHTNTLSIWFVLTAELDHEIKASRVSRVFTSSPKSSPANRPLRDHRLVGVTSSLDRGSIRYQMRVGHRRRRCARRRARRLPRSQRQHAGFDTNFCDRRQSLGIATRHVTLHPAGTTIPGSGTANTSPDYDAAAPGWSSLAGRRRERRVRARPNKLSGPGEHGDPRCHRVRRLAERPAHWSVLAPQHEQPTDFSAYGLRRCRSRARAISRQHEWGTRVRDRCA